MSRLVQRARQFVGRVRKVRRRRYLLRLYNDTRQMYYATSSRKQITSQLKVSIVVPCYNPPPAFFEELLSSVLAQSYADWELVLVDGSSNAAISQLIKTKAKSDTRIVYHQIENKGIATNTNAGLDLATGDLIAFLDHDDTLDPDALAYAVEQFEQFSGVGLVYTDEDKLTSDGSRYQDPHFKPDFSLDLIRNVNYITHFVVVRAKLARQVGGIRPGFEGAQDYDFLLRVIDTGTTVHHVPRVLYHWRLSESSTAANFSNKQFITDAGVKALNEHYERRGESSVHVEAFANRPGFYNTTFDLGPAKRAIIIALPDHIAAATKHFLVERFKRNQSVTGNKIDVLVVDKPTKATAHTYDSVMVVRDLIMPGNTRSDITQLFAAAEQEGVDGVSPKVVSVGKIDDMGLVATTPLGLLLPLFKGMEDHETNFFGSHEWVRNVSALTGRMYVLSGAALKAHNFEEHEPIRPRDGRLIVWSHIQMLGLANPTPPALDMALQNNYYNENLSAIFTPMVPRTMSPIQLMTLGEAVDEATGEKL